MDKPVKIEQKFAHEEAQKQQYTKHIGRSGRIWLVPVGEFCADNIHVAADPKENEPGYRGFQGYGGSTLEFALTDGTTIKLQGPWHSNSQALFEDTGVDVRRNHASRITIGLDMEYANQYSFSPIIKDVIFEEKDMIEGEFQRTKEFPKFWADKLGKPVYYHIQTGGGGQMGWKYPEGWTTEQTKAFQEQRDTSLKERRKLALQLAKAPATRPADKVFPKLAKLKAAKKCPFCKKAVDVSKFKDALSKKEFGISGLCQECQDGVFAA